MLKSMTAFARAELSDAGGDIVWEIKSVNHRYLEIGFKLPEEFRMLEPEIRGVVGRFLKRGKLDISLRYRLNRSTPATIRLNSELVKNLRSVEQEVLKIVHEGHSLAVADILRWPGVVEESELDFKPLQELAMSGLEQVLQQLVGNREREGQAIEEMIGTRCVTVSEIVDKVKARRPQVVEAIREKWSQQLNDKMAQWSESADAGRLEQELTLLVQKIDVDEELDRLSAHVKEVEQVLQRDEPVGRRLDFLMQELNREANTLSSKSQDLETTAHAVDLKVLIEQMREQVQNVE